MSRVLGQDNLTTSENLPPTIFLAFNFLIYLSYNIIGFAKLVPVRAEYFREFYRYYIYSI